MAEGLGEMALADAGGADEQDIVGALDEGGVGELEDLGLRKLGVEREIEGLEGPLVLEGGPLQASAELVGVASVDLVLKQPEEKLAVAELVLDRLLDAQVERLQDAGEPELLRMGISSSVGLIRRFLQLQ